MKQFLGTALKGFGMGAANVVPGVSGGTIALITGIYSRLIAAISAFASVSIWKLFFRGDFKKWWKEVDGNFLVALFVGLVVSILTLAKVVTWSLVEYPVITWAFFFGLIIVSAFYMLMDIKDKRLKDGLWIIIGIALGLAFCRDELVLFRQWRRGYMYHDPSGYFRQLYTSDLRKLRHHNEIPGRVGLELVRAGAVCSGRDSGNRGFFEISEMATVSLRKTDYASARGIRFGNYAEDMAVGR